jgi:hypothetical protein
METSEMIGCYRSIVAETLRQGEDGDFNAIAAKFLNDMGKVLETVVKLEMNGSNNNETLDYDALLGKFSDES